MRSLTANDILYIWEMGQHQHPIDRALTMLAAAMPDRTPAELAQLSIGRRDRLLLMLRELVVGQEIVSIAQCPQCGEQLELAMNVQDVQCTEPTFVIEPDTTVNLAELAVQIHLPNSYDLAAVVNCADVATAYGQLLQRCIVGVDRSGESISAAELPSAIVQQLSARLAEMDPQAEIILTPICPACGHSWQVLFDIVTFLWTELSGQARRLLQEVYRLARAYGWREADILAMSPLRRQFYLELVS
jgi:hypothetical protein